MEEERVFFFLSMMPLYRKSVFVCHFDFDDLQNKTLAIVRIDLQ